MNGLEKLGLKVTVETKQQSKKRRQQHTDSKLEDFAIIPEREKLREPSQEERLEIDISTLIRRKIRRIEDKMGRSFSHHTRQDIQSETWVLIVSNPPSPSLGIDAFKKYIYRLTDRAIYATIKEDKAYRISLDQTIDEQNGTVVLESIDGKRTLFNLTLIDFPMEAILVRADHSLSGCINFNNAYIDQSKLEDLQKTERRLRKRHLNEFDYRALAREYGFDTLAELEQYITIPE